MLKRALVVLVLALIQAGCDINYGENLYPLELWNLEEVRSRQEGERRKILKIEDLEVGKGPIASWGRRLKAGIEVRYADGGTTIYKGPIVTYVGFHGLILDYLQDRFMLNFTRQGGIQLGLNGMAIGGKRRIMVAQALVCDGPDAGKFPFTKRRWLSKPL
jgi:hypothetical protein